MLLNIQALRAVAALMVVLHHLAGSLARFGVPEKLLFSGASGVDIFFVISGFVMVHSTAHRPPTPMGFFTNRIVRVAPLYWLITIALASAVVVLPNMFRSVNVTPAGWLKSLAFIPYVNGDLGMTPILHVGWTLNYEMFFYAIFAVALALGGNNSKRIAGIACGALIALVALGAVFRPENAIAGFYTDPILIEFGSGMLLAVLHKHLRNVGIATASVALVAAAAALAMKQYFVPDLHRVIGWGGGPAGLIVAVALVFEARGMVARWGAVQLLGAASYALYLIHPLVLAAGTRLTAGLASPSLAALVTSAILVGVIVAAVVVHKLIEVPITRFLRRLFDRRRLAGSGSRTADIPGV
ncbi:MAG: acyltransferase [Sphingomonas sp.]|uniref:acyltransferase family protein n=1 Tax=Sphingomonas sp. TaxID=28214 RepID=UPI0017E2A9C2|nr:acyltransferase [Zymomonas sp.]MBA4773634.1 acyltransferase [Sphingomonas sp.]